MAVATSAIIAGAATLGAAALSAKGAKDAAKQAGNYQKVDIDALQKTARDASVQNAKDSIELEKALTPGVAEARQTQTDLVNSKLKAGGTLGADVANQVRQLSTEAGVGAGLNNTGALTAAQLGLTSNQLKNEAISAGQGFLSENKLPTVGLDPGQLASATVGDLQNLNAYNQVAAQQRAANANNQAKNLAAAGGIISQYFAKTGK